MNKSIDSRQNVTHGKSIREAVRIVWKTKVNLLQLSSSVLRLFEGASHVARDPLRLLAGRNVELQGCAHFEVTRVKKMDSTSSKEADDAVKS